MDDVGAHRYGKAVRYHDCCAPGYQLAHSVEPVGFRPGVHKTGGPIQNKYRSLPDERSGERNSLPVAYAQLRPARKPFAHHSLVTPRQPHDRLVSSRGARRLLDGFRTSVSGYLSEGNILAGG